MSSANFKGVRWSGEEESSFVDKLLSLELRDIMDDEQDYDIYIGKGGPNCHFYHHYIVVESPDLPIRSRRLILELSKTKDHVGRMKVVPYVRIFSGDGNPDYKITVTTTLRLLAELASQVLYYLGSYNLITASCQTFSDKFLKELGSSGYNTYVKTAGAAIVGSVATGAAAVGLLAAGVGLCYWLTGDKENKKK
ncbi:uncharacterized protein [Dysidea avara]|uniref:uncharacterized protein n=1 Tax=Dysidea avara TaxID=196820 RepID=UPI003328F441